MKLIPLVNGGCTLVDDDVYLWASKMKWRRGKDGYILNTKSGAPLHRLVMNTPKGMDTDHGSHRLWDNRRENLRVCTHAENQRNQVVQVGYNGRSKSSKYKGVFCRKRSSVEKWVAYITIECKCYRLGVFTLETDAALAYNEAALKFHGEFACLNVIDKEKEVV